MFVRDVTIGGNWVKGKRDFSVLYLVIAENLQLSQNYSLIFLKVL